LIQGVGREDIEIFPGEKNRLSGVERWVLKVSLLWLAMTTKVKIGGLAVHARDDG